MPGPMLNPITGPSTTADGNETGLRADRQKALVTTALNPTYAEQTKRGNTWTISAPVAGVAVTALNVIGTASSVAIVGLFNPAGNGSTLQVQRAVMTVMSGTMATGGFVWGVLPTGSGMAATVVGVNAVNNNTFQKGGHSARVSDSTITWTGSVATTLLRPFAGGPAGTVVAGSAMAFEEATDGDISIAPGCAAGLFVAVAATGLTVLPSLTWTEVPN